MPTKRNNDEERFARIDRLVADNRRKPKKESVSAKSDHASALQRSHEPREKGTVDHKWCGREANLESSGQKALVLGRPARRHSRSDDELRRQKEQLET